MADVVEAEQAPVDRDAALYAAVAPQLVRFACSLVGPTDAADVVSSAVVHSLASSTWRKVSDPRAYLYQAVYNEARSVRRRRAMGREREAKAVDLRRFTEMPDIRPDVAEAVAHLSLRQRAVIVLTYWADFDPGEVGRLLGISEGSVKRHLARARSHLREVLHV